MNRLFLNLSRFKWVQKSLQIYMILLDFAEILCKNESETITNRFFFLQNVIYDAIRARTVCWQNIWQYLHEPPAELPFLPFSDAIDRLRQVYESTCKQFLICMYLLQCFYCLTALCLLICRFTSFRRTTRNQTKDLL